VLKEDARFSGLLTCELALFPLPTKFPNSDCCITVPLVAVPITFCLPGLDYYLAPQQGFLVGLGHIGFSSHPLVPLPIPSWFLMHCALVPTRTWCAGQVVRWLFLVYDLDLLLDSWIYMPHTVPWLVCCQTGRTWCKFVVSMPHADSGCVAERSVPIIPSFVALLVVLFCTVPHFPV